MIAEFGESHLGFVAGNYHRLGEPRKLFAAVGVNWLGQPIDAAFLSFRHNTPIEKAADIVFRDTADKIASAVLLADATFHVGDSGLLL